MKYFLLITLYLGLLFSVTTRADINIQPGVSGAWITDASGQGAFINIARVNDKPNFLITWYAYLNGEQVWLIGSQPFDYGIQQLTIPMSITSGANWGEDFLTDDVQVIDWGSVTIDFTDCSNGVLQYNSSDENFGSGTIALMRITNTDGLSCHENTDTTGQESLAFMREEEKMARDVYLMFNQQYGVNIFTNIADSEQTHMDSVLNLMNVYDIPDSSTGVVGTFNNTDLQNLYDILIDMGSAGLSEAYLASALIEETDIRDLEIFMQNITAEDIINTYDNLLCGSRNHMRSFVSQYENLTGEEYEVQIPEMEEVVEQILNSDNEQCGSN